MTFVSLDTNIFVHGRPLSELRWAEISKSASITVLVTQEVQSEIAAHRRSEGRRAKRARAASELFRKALNSPYNEIVLRQAGPALKLRLELILPINWRKFPQLNKQVADDRIIAEASKARDNLKTELIFISDDTATILKARAVGLTAILMPDNWQLPPESDTAQKKIVALEKELSDLRRSRPSISGWFGPLESTCVAISAPVYRPLSDSEKGILINHFLSKNPQEEVTIWRANGISFGPSERQNTEYEKDYNKFVSATRKYFDELIRCLNIISKVPRIKFSLSNQGFAPALGVIVDLKPDAGVRLFDPAVLQKITPPVCPAMPTSFMEMTRTSLPDLSHLMRPKPPRDPHRLYWDEDRDPSREIRRGVCEELRHQSTPSETEICVRLPLERNVDRLMIRASISARNIPEPFEVSQVLNITYRNVSAFDELTLETLTSDINIRSL